MLDTSRLDITIHAMQRYQERIGPGATYKQLAEAVREAEAAPWAKKAAISYRMRRYRDCTKKLAQKLAKKSLNGIVYLHHERLDALFLVQPKLSGLTLVTVFRASEMAKERA